MFDPPEDNPVHRFSRSVVPTSKKTKDQVFAFDRVFDDTTNQSDVYEATTKTLLDSVLDGYNATVFAYGATGCGKTHTITGTSQQPGIIFLTMQELFEKIEERSQDKTTELSLSYLEIYNETIRDLLVPAGSGPKGGLMLREDSNQAVSVSGLSTHNPKDVQEVMDMIVQGNEYRTVSPTEANATSSRSHAVLQINVAQKDRNADVNEPHTMATLSIIDLAGSERASVTKNRGERLTEGANINKSLLALGSCINALCDRRGRAHIPYRNSKLTRLLKFSLGGNCKTVMIVCVSPSSAHFDETQNTLRYANRAKNIQTKVTRNVFNVNRHVKDFLVKIDEQMALINELKAQQKESEKLAFAKFRKQTEKRQCIVQEGMQRLRTAYDNSLKDRNERLSRMKKLKSFERRIALLSGWIAAFDTVCDQRTDDPMPQNLSAIKKTAQGIMAELENSRRHIHTQLEKPTWERSIDTALSHSLTQLEGTDGSDSGEVASLVQEAELLKSHFNCEAHKEVLDQDKVGDAAMVQMLLTAQFDIICSLADTLAMDEDAAVAHAKNIINRLLQTGLTAASQVVKPDGTMPVVEIFPPTKKGTPKRKSNAAVFAKPMAPPNFAAAAPSTEHVHVSPMKASPRRRKVVATKKGVSFTPVKKAKARGVRWRDDENDTATLADFSQTPQKIKSSPVEQPVVRVSEASLPVLSEKEEDKSQDSTEEPATKAPQLQDQLSPLRDIPESSGMPASRPSRFSAGFLSKSARLSTVPGGSPTPPSLSLSLNSSSPEAGRTPPALRSLDVGKTGNLSPPSGVPRLKVSPNRSLDVIMDENSITANSASGSDSESSIIDPRKLRSAMHSQKEKARRASLMTGPSASNSRRISSVGSVNGDKTAPRPSMPGPLASSTNGISRHRRGSNERRRSPPMSCSPSEWKADRSFTAGQARRMNMGGSMRVENLAGGSPKERTGMVGDKARRVTINVGGAGAHRRQESRGHGNNTTSWR